MFEYYKDLPKSQIELLVSLPSAGIMLTLFLNTFIERFLDERKMIITGLLILSIFGMVPFINQAYPILFISRFIFGMGVGLINAKDVSIISERYHGRERVQTLGFRGSAEVVGTALVTLLVGFLLQFGWTSSFPSLRGRLNRSLSLHDLCPLPPARRKSAYTSQSERTTPKRRMEVNYYFGHCSRNDCPFATSE